MPDAGGVELGEYIVGVQNPSEVEDVLRLVRGLGYEIDTLETENESLEDVFLSIMKASPERSE